MNRLYAVLLTPSPSFPRKRESRSLTPNGLRSESPSFPHPFALSLSKGAFTHPFPSFPRRREPSPSRLRQATP